MNAPFAPEQLRIVAANEASWDDLFAIFGTTDAGHCQCQRFKVLGWIWRDSTHAERTEMLRSQTGCDDPRATSTSGLVAYVDDEPAGWVAVEPPPAYPKLCAAVDHARECGARTLEVYAMVTQSGKQITSGELHVGARQVFGDAGFVEVTHSTVRRRVMRVDFSGEASDETLSR